MPKQVRWQVKRDLDKAIGNINRSTDTIIQLGSLYEKDHPVIYAQFCAIVSGLELYVDVIQKLRDRI